MEKHEISNRVIAFVHSEGRSSFGLIRTTDGVVLIDTTARPVDVQACLDLAGVTPDDVCLILITHSHSDHTSGIPLFTCPILAHKLTYQRINNRGTKRSKLQVPTETFDERRELEIGGVKMEMIHLGGHTPGSSVVWLPDERVLFAGDLIFEGRYPFLATANVLRLMDALRWIPSLDARLIVPGHGVPCKNDEVLKQLDYIEKTWEITIKHIALGHSLGETLSDPAYPCYSGLGRDKLHPWNIKVIYHQLIRLQSSNKLMSRFPDGIHPAL
jgi:cyclase